MGFKWAWTHLLDGLRLGLICLIGLGLELGLGPTFLAGSGALVWSNFSSGLELGWIWKNLTNQIQSNYNHHNFVVLAWRNLIDWNFLFYIKFSRKLRSEVLTKTTRHLGSLRDKNQGFRDEEVCEKALKFKFAISVLSQ